MGESFEGFAAARGAALRRLALELCGDPVWAAELAEDALAKIGRRWKKAEAGDPERSARRLIVTAFLAGRREAEERAVLVLHRHDQAPPEEIAAMTGIGRGRVAAILAGAPEELPAVAGRTAPRRLGRWAAAVAVLVAVPLAAYAMLRTTDDPVVPGPVPTQVRTPEPVPVTWVYAGTGGAEIAVPGAWAKKRLFIEAGDHEYFDEEPGRPAVYLSSIGRTHLGPAAGYTTFKAEPVTVLGLPGERMESRLPDGMYAGYVRIASRRIVATVRAGDPATVTRILDTLRLVDVDAAGCFASRLAAHGPTRRPVPARPDSVLICAYTAARGGDQVIIKHSVRLTGRAAVAMATLLRGAEPVSGRRAARCGTVPDGLITFIAGKETTVALHAYGCGRYLIDDGRRRTAFGFYESPYTASLALLNDLFPGASAAF
ncbi:hypothetical protein [Actinocorallia longicatena]|uniref:DNA-directed RNA polymerase specialized sigma24 family protein n=1 Tax=Actinocorallia longicatena TaxID=111803 RepID=A0ABP6QLI5_9ACTN